MQREVIRLGLEHTRGNYKMLVDLFNTCGLPAELSEDLDALVGAVKTVREVFA